MKTEKTSAPMSVKAGGSKKAAASSGGASSGRLSPTSEDIARRSYELFLARGGESGHDVADWLQAEAELRGS